ncbi:MAG TPA: hypothetical protein VHP33_28125 [Polyangiaceae bacterium]|nr:hypothetical protein [Polyangiaceae bacterium]
MTILDAIQERTGLFTRSDALRFALRHYAKAEGIALGAKKPAPKKPKR